MYLNGAWLIFCILLVIYGLTKGTRRRPIVDLQHAEARILGAASRSDLHPGPYSPTVVYYPSVPIKEDNHHDNMEDQDEDDCADSTTVHTSLESEEHSTHPLYGFYSGYSMVSSKRDA